MKYIYYLLVFISMYGCYPKPNKSLSYIHYSININKANVCILYGEYDKSIAFYYKAFKLNNNQFISFSHAINALLACCKTKNVKEYTIFYNYVNAHYTCRKYLNEITKNCSYHDLKETEIPKLKSTFSEIHRYYLDSILSVDQNGRETMNQWERSALDSQNLISFLHFYKKFGYPIFQKTGVFCFKNERGYDHNLISTVLNHFSYKHDSLMLKKDFNNLLADAFKNGQIPVEIFAAYCSEGKNKYRLDAFYYINDKLYINNSDKKNKININNERKKVGLPSLEEQFLFNQNKNQLDEDGFQMLKIYHRFYIDGEPNKEKYTEVLNLSSL